MSENAAWNDIDRVAFRLQAGCENVRSQGRKYAKHSRQHNRSGEGVLMGCLFGFFALGIPRMAVLLLWMARPEYFASVLSNSWLLGPLIGVFFLPIATLLFVLLWTPGVGLTGLDWLFVGIGLLLDFAAIFGSGWFQRRSGSGYKG